MYHQIYVPAPFSNKLLPPTLHGCTNWRRRNKYTVKCLERAANSGSSWSVEELLESFKYPELHDYRTYLGLNLLKGERCSHQSTAGCNLNTSMSLHKLGTDKLNFVFAGKCGKNFCLSLLNEPEEALPSVPPTSSSLIDSFQLLTIGF